MGRVLMLLGALTALVTWADVHAAGPPQPTRVAGLDPAPVSVRRPRAALPAAPLATADAPETVSVGYAPWSTDPNKVGVGGVWDFDTETAGTDSMQFWTSVTVPAPQDNSPGPPSRYFDYGNNINLGNHALWKARLAAGRAFRRTGVAGVWHVDPMTGVSAPIAGARSAWCGLRIAGDCAVRDELTNNCFESSIELQDLRGGGMGVVRSTFPGYSDRWDQLLYRDFSYAGTPIPLSFRFRANLSSFVTNDINSAPWYTPDPTDTLNLVLNPADSLEVWVGAPREAGVYDPNRRWLSEVLDFAVPGAGQPRMLMAVCANGANGRVPLAGSDTSVVYSIPGAREWGPTVRVVFRVKTNQTDSDLRSQTQVRFNSVDGAALVDDVSVGGVLCDFEDSLAIRPRVLLGPSGEETWIDPSTTWITTGRPAPAYGHIHDMTTLPFDHPAIGPGDTTWACNMSGNVLVGSNHDDAQHRFMPQVYSWTVSPTICLTGPRAAAQGIPETLRGEVDHVVLRFDWYTGFDDLYYSGVWMMAATRYMGSGIASLLQPASPQASAWTQFAAPGYDMAWGSPACMVWDSDGMLDYGQPWPYLDSLQVTLFDQTRCARFGSTDCGNVRGHYFDNIRVQFVRPAPFTGIPLEPRLDFVRGAFPNPSPDGTATVRFTLRRAAEVRIAFYDLRGALAHEGRVPAVAGPNEYRWPGTTRSGERAAAGVYFYRLFADGVEFRNNAQRIVVLETGAR